MIAQAQNKPETDQLTGKEPLKGKREKFAQLIATGTKDNTQAAREAGYKDRKPLRIYACRMLTMSNIKARIAYIKAELAKKWDITKDSQTKQYIDIRERAITAGDLRAEIAANQAIDKISGLIVDKVQTERSDAQTAYDATQRRLGAAFAKWQLERSLVRPEVLEAVSVVDITGPVMDISGDKALVGCSSGCSDDALSAITGQEQG